MARNRTCGSAQKRPTQDRACESSALPNYDELEMDSSAPRNGIMDARLQPSLPINPCFVSKVRTDPIAIPVRQRFLPPWSVRFVAAMAHRVQRRASKRRKEG